MKSLILKSLHSDALYGPLIARVTLGIVMLPHGLQKTLGLFGGGGFSGTLEVFTGKLGIPLLIAVLVIAAESLGALALILGFFTRFCALSMVIVMLGAMAMHWENGFFMNWFGNQAGEGFEYHLLAIGLGLSIALSGAGIHSLDGVILEKFPCD